MATSLDLVALALDFTYAALERRNRIEEIPEPSVLVTQDTLRVLDAPGLLTERESIQPIAAQVVHTPSVG